MKCSKDPFSGIIHFGEKDALTFHAEDFTFSFMSTSLCSFDSAFGLASENDIPVSSPDGFIYGVTHDNHQIAIFSGCNPIIVNGAKSLHTSLFLISKSNLVHKSTDFNAIRFSGGTLNSLFSPKGLLPSVNNSEQISYARQDDSLEYSFQVAGMIYTVSIFSMVHEVNGYSGHLLENKEVCLRVAFESPQPITELQKHCRAIYTLVQFMTHRQNIDFDSISLQQKNARGQFESCHNVYIARAEASTTKNITQNITFENLLEHIAPLLQKIYSKDFIRLDFIPTNDENVDYMSDTKIKSLCTALECLAPDSPNENEALFKLVDLVKKEIHQYRDANPNTITKNTYSLIFSSIDHWTASAAERVWALCCQHRAALQILGATLFNDSPIISENNVSAVIQYRNKSTHSFALALDDKTAQTALLLVGTVYCSILDSIGMTDAQICNLCEHLKIAT